MTASLSLNQYNKNTEASSAHIVETYINGTSWYRIWSDGWCEQGGEWTYVSSGTGNGSTNIELLKEYADLNYTVLLGHHAPNGWTNGRGVQWYTQTTTTFYIYQCDGYGACWKTEGYAK